MFRLFSGLRIRARLSAAFLLVAVLGGAIGAFGVWGLARINDMNSELSDVDLRGLSEMKDASLQLAYAGRARNSYLAAGT
ncbi:Tar ligand binding domain-containing protein, partial [Klebsiella pneumoniae]|uniref:Tar ligand binding domain-containing protein n=1 Tax=Klebsiella pneumoniae TaxID=573 RepID=UPI0015FE1A08